LASNGELHPLQKAFVEHDALQCGYCTPGMIMNAYGLLLENPEPRVRTTTPSLKASAPGDGLSASRTYEDRN